MAEISPLDKERVDHINFIMQQLYESLPDLYEAMVDKEYVALKKKANEIIKHLKNLIESTEDET